jgi:microcystin-dependent protein
MTEVYLGQIMMTGFGFPPRGFVLCNGQLLPLNQYQALFALIGTYYGGNGTTNFQLPNLQGRTPVGQGSSVDPSWQPAPLALGLSAGTENVTIDQTTLPNHAHQLTATTRSGSGRSPSGGIAAASSNTAIKPYAPVQSNLVPLYAETLAQAGGSQPHGNVQPMRVISFSLAMSGVFPSRN